MELERTWWKLLAVVTTTTRQRETDNRQLKDRQVEIYRTSTHTHTHKLLTGGGWSSQRQACWTHYEQVGVCVPGQNTNWRSWMLIQWTLVEGRDYTPLKCELAHLLDMQGLRKWCGMSRMFIPGTEGRRCASTSVTDAVDETTVAFRANISRVTVERSKDTMLALVNISYFFCVQINPPFMLLLCLISLLAFSLYIQTCVVFMQMQYNRISIFHN